MTMKAKKNIFLICIWLFFCRNLAASLPVISFDDFSSTEGSENGRLETLEGQLVQIRGFWYPLPSGRGVLAPHPQLKSCCLQASSKIGGQLLVFGPSLASLPPQRALTLEGKFYIRPKYNSEGELIQLYILDEAEEVRLESSSGAFLFFLIPLAPFIFLGGRYLFSKKE